MPKAATLPEPVSEVVSKYELPEPGCWLVLGDVHIPFHDRVTVQCAIAEAKRRRVVGVLLNGDTLDSHEISDHDKDPAAPRYVDEIKKGL